MEYYSLGENFVTCYSMYESSGIMLSKINQAQEDKYW